MSMRLEQLNPVTSSDWFLASHPHHQPSASSKMQVIIVGLRHKLAALVYQIGNAAQAAKPSSEPPPALSSPAQPSVRTLLCIRACPCKFVHEDESA